jgi:catechol 2,3-dioxygenase-like lactoylglutathione lyase family enzyme
MAKFKAKAGFSGFSVDDLAAAKQFYGKTLGLKVNQDRMGLRIQLPGGAKVYVYPKSNHKPATFTILNLIVNDIDGSVDDLRRKGVKFERYNKGMIKTDKKGIARGRARKIGPDIAWFKDPAGNFISIIEDSK